MTLALYGHPFSSYTWKVQIALYSEGIDHEFRIIDADHPEHLEVLRTAGPWSKFPVLADGDNLLFEATSIIEYLAQHHARSGMLIPGDPDAAIGMRMLDRVFDNYVMGATQDVVNEYLRNRSSPDAARIEEAGQRLARSYAWLEDWLKYYPAGEQVTLIECAAAPALFYADWVSPIADSYPRLRAWRRQLLRLPAVARCVEDARPFRASFPPGAPDRD
ncbi:glutathione S-transferase family protein [Novosphingobium sp. M1R2S20]|uniref:Glutathione S-transferase family protein n=1 Tax=Novosphingobium rhizovicinum TaxID=3228928 RepID=A0ABV3RFI3_9SPHN